MITVDSSVAIAAFSTWHDQHHAALKVLDEQPRMAAHAAVETYSVLTRMPPPHRASGELAREFLQDSFGDDLLDLSGADITDFLNVAQSRGVVGGAIYDAMIGYTALRHDAELVTADIRATRVYEALGVRRRMLT